MALTDQERRLLKAARSIILGLPYVLRDKESIEQLHKRGIFRQSLAGGVDESIRYLTEVLGDWDDVEKEKEEMLKDAT